MFYMLLFDWKILATYFTNKTVFFFCLFSFLNCLYVTIQYFHIQAQFCLFELSITHIFKIVPYIIIKQFFILGMGDKSKHRFLDIQTILYRYPKTSGIKKLPYKSVIKISVQHFSQAFRKSMYK